MTSLKDKVVHLWKHFLSSQLKYECGHGVGTVYVKILKERGREILKEKGKYTNKRKQNSQVWKLSNSRRFAWQMNDPLLPEFQGHLVPHCCQSFVCRTSLSSPCAWSKPREWASICLPFGYTFLHFLYNVFHFAMLKFRTFLHQSQHMKKVFSVVLNVMWNFRGVAIRGVCSLCVIVGSTNGNSCDLLYPLCIISCVISFNFFILFFRAAPAA